MAAVPYALSSTPRRDDTLHDTSVLLPQPTERRTRPVLGAPGDLSARLEIPHVSSPSPESGTDWTMPATVPATATPEEYPAITRLNLCVDHAVHIRHWDEKMSCKLMSPVEVLPRSTRH
jgi:hypothetical protein